MVDKTHKSSVKNKKDKPNITDIIGVIVALSFIAVLVISAVIINI